jgi:hypothetical protein
VISKITEHLEEIKEKGHEGKTLEENLILSNKKL